MITRARKAFRVPLRTKMRRLKGMGQDSTDTSLTDVSAVPIGSTSASVTLPDLSMSPPAVLPTTPSGSSVWSQILSALPAAAQTGVNIYRQTQSPSLVPGTTAVYNPATGTYYNPTTGQVVTPSGQTTFGGSIGTIDPSLLMMGGLLIGGVLLISMLGRGR